jgi:hypothetical protein
MPKWINKFEQLLLSDKSSDLNQVFALKSKYVPMKLYKYFLLDQKDDLSFERLIDIISNNNLYLPLPINFYDPFEFHSFYLVIIIKIIILSVMISYELHNMKKINRK